MKFFETKEERRKRERKEKLKKGAAVSFGVLFAGIFSLFLGSKYVANKGRAENELIKEDIGKIISDISNIK